MNIDEIRRKILGYSKDFQGNYKYYAILVPMIKINHELHLLFEVRSSELKRQPGEICFPGGKKELNETFEETAIRETIEELNISSDNIEVIGELPSVSTHYNNIIRPFAATLKDIDIKNINYNKGEVDNIFTVPLDFFLNNSPQQYYIITEPNPQEGFPYHLLPNGEDYPWFKGKYHVYFYQYESYVIWGLTAKTILNLVEILK